MESKYEVVVGDERFVLGKRALQTMIRDTIVQGVVASCAIEDEVITEEEANVLYSTFPPDNVPDTLLTT